MNAQYQLMAPPAPTTKEMQETINHLVLGITMWISVTVTCVTTLLTVNNPWCLIALAIPFVYTMFPQIQKATANAREAALNKYKTMRDTKSKENPDNNSNQDTNTENLKTNLITNDEDFIEVEITEPAV